MKELQIDVLERVDALASVLKTTSEYLYSVLVHQALINSISGLFLVLLGIFISIVIYKLLPPTRKVDWYEESIGSYAWIFYCIWLFIFFIVSSFNINYIVTGFVNPEYIAIKEIMKALN